MSTVMEAGASFSTVESGDSTKIAYVREGSGPPLVLVGGALNDRNSTIAGLPVAELLGEAFTVYAYDRRGRGDSGDTAPYAVQREVEDLAAVIEAAGKPVFMFGHSSGAALALEAAAADLPIRRLAVYEPPYSVDAEADAGNKTFAAEIAALLRDGRRADAVLVFLEGAGVPQDMIEGMRQSPYWSAMEAMASTLSYDLAVLRKDDDSLVPRERFSAIDIPLLAMAGEHSPDWMRGASRSVADAAPHGRYLEIAGHDHMVPAEAVAAILKSFLTED